MTSGGGRTYAWNALDLPTSVTATAIPPAAGTPNGAAPGRGGTASGAPNYGAAGRGGPTIAGAVPDLAAANRGTGTAGGATETYSYDADGQAPDPHRRGDHDDLRRRGLRGGRAGTSRVTRSQYVFNGQVIAQRSSAGTNPLVFLHGDQLGSVSVATSATGAVLDRQEYGPWGM